MRLIDDEVDDSKVKSVQCIDQISGELFKDGTLRYGQMFKKNAELKAFYDRTLNHIHRLPTNLSDTQNVPSFVWRLNARELSKYGTFLFANWKQPSDGNATLPLNEFEADLEERRWLASKKWFVYRLRYWKRESEDILDFLDDVGTNSNEAEEDGVDWFGSNGIAKHTLIEDRLCVQNDHCFGNPTQFLWTHDFVASSTGSSVVKIRNYGVAESASNHKPANEDNLLDPNGESLFDLDAPIVPTGKLPTDGPIRSGFKLPIGCKSHDIDYADIDGVVAMDAYIPPILNLSVYDDMDSLHFNWNRVNHSSVPDRASSKRMDFTNKRREFERLIADENNILKSWDEQQKEWIDFANFPVFDALHHSHPSLLSNAFFFSMN